MELQNSIQQLEAKNEQKSGENENLKGALQQMQLERDGLSKQSEAQGEDIKAKEASIKNLQEELEKERRSLEQLHIESEDAS